MKALPHADPSDLSAVRRLRGFWAWLGLVPLLGVLFLVVARKAVSPVEYANSDFFTFWLSGHLAALGQDPYIASTWTQAHHEFGATWIPNATFIYPQPVSLLFIPLGLLPVYPAFVVWAILSQFMILASLLLLLKARADVPAVRFILPLIAGIAIFRSTVVTLHNGQLAALLLLVTSAIVYLWEKGGWAQGAVLLPLLALKPNLGVPVILFLSAYLIYRRRIQALLLGAFAGLLLIVLGLLQNPRWIAEFWSAGNTKLAQIFGIAPTLWGISTYLCKYNGACSLTYGALASTLTLIAGTWLAWSNRRVLSPLNVVALACTVMLLLTPTAWPYDQLLLLIPIVAITRGLANAGVAFLPVALLFPAIAAIGWVLLGVSASIETEVWNFAIPLLVLGLLGWSLSVENRKAQTAS